MMFSLNDTTRTALRRLVGFYAIALFITAITVWVFLEASEAALEPSMGAINTSILLAIHRLASPAGDAIALSLSAIGSTVGTTLVGLALGGWLLRRHRRLDTATLVAVLGGDAVLVTVLKSAYHHARPELFARLVQETTYSFPSGHATMALSLYGFIAVLLVADAPRDLRRWGLALLSVAFALGIGASRLYLGVHWPTDVLAGFALASGWLAICVAGRFWFRTYKG